MANTYTTTVTSLETATVNGLDNVVVVINWQISGTDGTNTVSYNGSNVIGAPDPTNFVAYFSLTQAQVLAWILNPLTATAMANIDQALALMSNPPAPTPLPWG